MSDSKIYLGSGSIVMNQTLLGSRKAEAFLLLFETTIKVKVKVKVKVKLRFSAPSAGIAEIEQT